MVDFFMGKKTESYVKPLAKGIYNQQTRKSTNKSMPVYISKLVKLDLMLQSTSTSISVKFKLNF